MTQRALMGAMLLTATLVVALTPSVARATCGTSCTVAYLVDSACNTIEGKLQAAPLYFVADCSTYCDPKMGPEYITHGKLTAEDIYLIKSSDDPYEYDPSGPLSGTVARDGACAGVPRFRFDGVLAAQTAYTVASDSHFLFSFETAPEDQFEADADVGCSVGPRAPSSAGGGGALVLLLALGAALILRRRR